MMAAVCFPHPYSAVSVFVLTIRVRQANGARVPTPLVTPRDYPSEERDVTTPLAASGRCPHMLDDVSAAVLASYDARWAEKAPRALRYSRARFPGLTVASNHMKPPGTGRAQSEGG